MPPSGCSVWHGVNPNFKKSGIKRYKKIGKLTTGQDEDYITGSLLDCDYIKNHKLIAVDLRWQKALNADPKVIQQIEFVRQLKEN